MGSFSIPIEDDHPSPNQRTSPDAFNSHVFDDQGDQKGDNPTSSPNYSVQIVSYEVDMIRFVDRNDSMTHRIFPSLAEFRARI